VYQHELGGDVREGFDDVVDRLAEFLATVSEIRCVEPVTDK
jgi:hypothetical protein